MGKLFDVGAVDRPPLRRTSQTSAGWRLFANAMGPSGATESGMSTNGWWESISRSSAGRLVGHFFGALAVRLTSERYRARALLRCNRRRSEAYGEPVATT